MEDLKRRQKTAFGEYLVDQIKKANMMQEEFYNAVGIKKPYFYDILTSAPPPDDLQKRMLAVLEDQNGTDIERRRTFYDLAAKCRDEIPVDISSMIKEYPENWDAIRTALSALGLAHH